MLHSKIQHAWTAAECERMTAHAKRLGLPPKLGAELIKRSYGSAYVRTLFAFIEGGTRTPMEALCEVLLALDQHAERVEDTAVEMMRNAPPPPIVIKLDR